MIKLLCLSGCVGILVLCTTSAGYGPFDGLDWHMGEGNNCCTSVAVKSEDQALELRRLGITWRGVGSLAMPFSEETWNVLKQAGFEPELTCLELVRKQVLDKRIWETHLGPKSKNKAARPVLARFKEEGSTEKGEVSGLLFLDDALNVVATELNATEAYVSGHANLVAVSRPTDESGAWASRTWEIFEGRGRKKGFVLTGVPDIEFPNGLVLSNAGNLAEMTQVGKLKIIFYDSDLHTIKEVVASEDGVIYASIHPRFSHDGRFLALEVVRPNRKNEVMLYDSDGHRVWSAVPDELLNSPGSISVANGGSYVVSSFCEWDYDRSVPSWGVTYVFDKRGSVVRKIPDFTAKDAIFSSSQESAALLGGLGPQGIIVLELPSGEIVFHYQTKNTLEQFDYGGDGELVAALTPSHLLLLDSRGNDIWDLEVPGPVASPNTQLSVSEDGREILLIVGTDVLTYRVLR